MRNDRLYEDSPFGYSGRDLRRLNQTNRGRFEDEDYDEEKYNRELRRKKKERRQMKRDLLLMAARGLLL